MEAVSLSLVKSILNTNSKTKEIISFYVYYKFVWHLLTLKDRSDIVKFRAFHKIARLLFSWREECDVSVCFENVWNSNAFKNVPKFKAKHCGTGKESMIRLMSYANHLSTFYLYSILTT